MDRGVAFLCHPYHRGGVTRWMVDAAAEFRRRGVPVWFVSPEPRRQFASGAGRPTMASLVRALPPAERPALLAPTVGIPFELGTQAYRTAVYSRAISQGVPKGVPIIVSDDPAVWAGAATVSDRHPMIGVLHSDNAKGYALALKYRGQLSQCVAVSQRIAKGMARQTEIATQIIPCGVPIRKRLEASRNDQRPRLVWIGRIDEEPKRVSDLPLIAEALRARGLQFTLTIVGDGPQRAWLEREINARGLTEEVRLTGWKEANEIWSLLCASDLLVLPSNFEGMPVVVMEALAAGCAVVASRVSGVEDMNSSAHAPNALFTHDIGDTEQAASLITAALSIPLATRRQAAQAVAREMFSIAVCVDRYQHILDRIENRNSPKRITTSGTVLAGALSLPLAMVRSVRRKMSQRA